MQQHTFDSVVRQRGAALRQAIKMLPEKQRQLNHRQIHFPHGSQAPLERKTLVAPSRPFSQLTRIHKRSTDQDLLPDAGVVGLGILQSADDDTTVTPRERELDKDDEHGSPGTQMLLRQLQDVNEALEQLKDQLLTSRTRQWSNSQKKKALPEVPVVAKRRPKGFSRRTPNLRHQSSQVRFNCGGSPDNSAQQEVQPTSSLYTHTSPAMTHRTDSPHLSSQKYMPSPSIASSVDSTPRVLATPTFGSSARWNAPSPTVMSTSAFRTSSSTTSRTTTQATSSSSTSQSYSASAAAPHTSDSTSRVIQVPLQTAQSSAHSSDTTAERSQSNANGRHVAIASSIAGGVVGSVLVLLLLLWACLAYRRKRQRRRSGLNNALEKIAPLPVLPSRSVRSGGGNSMLTEPLATGTSPGSVPTFTTSILGLPNPTSPRFLLTPHNAIETDLEANQRHSHDLVQSGVISGYSGQVTRDLSFTWMFPKLSVPPAAARALTAGHYVKKRSVRSEPVASPSMHTMNASASNADMTMSTSIATSMAFPGNQASASIFGAPHTTTEEGSAPSAAASSEAVDPQLYLDQRSLLSQKNSLSRIQWWGSALRGQSQGEAGARTSARSSRNWITQARVSTNGNVARNSNASQERSRRISHVLAAHDPMMQSVVEKILFMSEDEQELYRKSANSDETDYSGPHGDENATVHSRPTSSTFMELRRASSNSASLAMNRRIRPTDRRASGVSVRTTLETCNEESQDRQTLPISHESSSATSGRTAHASKTPARIVAAPYSQEHKSVENVMMEDDNYDDETMHYLETIFGNADDDTVMPHASPILSRASPTYSNHSIVIHSPEGADDKIEDSLDEDSAASLAHSIPAMPDQRRRTSVAPRIMLTTSEEDGRHERQISVTSVDSTVRSISSGSLNEGDESGSAGHVSLEQSYMSSSTSSSGSDDSMYGAYSDIASSIGQAFVVQANDERDRTQTRASLGKVRSIRDSESTIDPLIAYARTARLSQEDDDDDDGDAVAHYYDDLEADDPHRNVAFDDAYMEAAEALYDFAAMTKTSSGHSQTAHSIVSRHSYTPSETGTACLIDDDFPTIPAWKPVPNDSPWRSTSFARVVQP